tara:strand:- start:2231 stop:2719 length:489 start_codon:yes stop_codon:yes gene_type:complete
LQTLDKWVERIYAETDVGRSIATSVAGVIGLSAYLLSTDWVIAAFLSIIAFPLVRLIATGVHARAVSREQSLMELAEAERIYSRLSEEERTVVQAFVGAGGSVLTWDQVNRLGLPAAGVESLVQREMVWSSMTADGMRETFALDSSLFDVGQKKLAHEKSLG